MEKFSADEVLSLMSIAIEEFDLFTPDPGLIPSVRNVIGDRPPMGMLCTWWNAIPAAFTVTGVGKALGYANALAIDELDLVPPLDTDL